MLEGVVRPPLHDERLEALDQESLAVGKILHQACGRAHRGGGVGIAVAPPPTPLLDLRLLDVGLGEGRVELQRLVEATAGAADGGGASSPARAASARAASTWWRGSTFKPGVCPSCERIMSGSPWRRYPLSGRGSETDTGMTTSASGSSARASSGLR